MEDVIIRAKTEPKKAKKKIAITNNINSDSVVSSSYDDDSDSTYSNLYKMFDEKGEGYVVKNDIINALASQGIQKDDVRIKETMEAFNKIGDSTPISLSSFKTIVAPNISLIDKALTGGLIIPDFPAFTNELSNICDEILHNRTGKVANYIPQLSRVNPEHFAMSVCTVDGQYYSFNNESDISYCVQSTCKPVNYCIALELHGEEKVHNHIGREPSGRSFNEIVLNNSQRPHNPLINAGAIMCSSLVKPEECLADRFDYIHNVWTSLCGNRDVGFNNSIYHSEKETADRNFALAHFMKEVGAFPQKTDIHETLDFYFQCCSIEVTASQHAVVAATLANTGVCPTTEKRIFKTSTVQNCLSLMYSCGMYDFSGEYAFSVGLPAKSGVSGALIIVIPNVAGIAIWSPRLDELGNTVRGVEFSKKLVERFNFHNYDSLTRSNTKIDPRLTKSEAQTDLTFSLIWAASQGDLNEVKRIIGLGFDLNMGDYDKRTAIHLAAAEGHLGIVEYIVNQGGNPAPKDRWNNTPLDDAKRHNHKDVQKFLEHVA
ncbi:MAG: glutaminase A [Rickettsiales bacterium]|nr:glutaminase A [Rickettsiales bacterium]